MLKKSKKINYSDLNPQKGSFLIFNSFKNYAVFACDFETTAHKEFTDLDFIVENRASQAADFGDSKTNQLIPDNYSQVFLAGTMNVRTGGFWVDYENLALFFNRIVSQTLIDKHKKAVVFFHNLAYDGSYILNWLIRNGWNQSLLIDEKTMSPILKRHQFACLISGGKFFNLAFFWKGVRINFLDSLKLLPQSLASLGETVGFKKTSETVDYQSFKLKIDHNYPIEWIDYLKRDCLILSEIIKNFLAKENITLKKATIGSVAFSHIKSLINENVAKNTIEDFYFYNQWYHGGLAFVNRNKMAQWIFSPDKIKMVDACSMYPSQMVKPMICGGKSSKIHENWNTYVSFYCIKIIKASIKPVYNDIAILPNPYLWFGKNKKARVDLDETGQPLTNLHQYTQLVENSIYHFIDCEWELIKQLYEIDYQIIDTFYFETKPYLTEKVFEMFKEKQTASRNHEETLKLIAKLKINNLYGKLGQKPIRQQDFYGKIEEIDTDKYEILSKKNGYENAYNIQPIKDDSDFAQPVQIAAHITALARSELIKKYLHIKREGAKFLYADTDSIIYKENEKEIIFNDLGDNLGEWEYETDKKTGQPIKADGFIGLAPKQYRIVKIGYDKPVKFACAGCKKEVIAGVKNQDYNFELDENTGYNIKKTSLKIGKYGKIITDNSPFSFKKWKHIYPRIKCPKELYN